MEQFYCYCAQKIERERNKYVLHFGFIVQVNHMQIYFMLLKSHDHSSQCGALDALSMAHSFCYWSVVAFLLCSFLFDCVFFILQIIESKPVSNWAKEMNENKEWKKTTTLSLLRVPSLSSRYHSISELRSSQSNEHWTPSNRLVQCIFMVWITIYQVYLLFAAYGARYAARVSMCTTVAIK